jgi:type IV secretory pathway TrbL component
MERHGRDWAGCLLCVNSYCYVESVMQLMVIIFVLCAMIFGIGSAMHFASMALAVVLGWAAILIVCDVVGGIFKS